MAWESLGAREKNSDPRVRSAIVEPSDDELTPSGCRTDEIDRPRVLAELTCGDLVPASWLPTLELRRERARSRWRLDLVEYRSTLKNRVRSTVIAFGYQVAMAELFGHGGR